MNPDMIDGWRELAAYTGLHPVSVRRMIERGDGFPLPLRPSQRRVIWLRAEVDLWLRGRPRGLRRLSEATRAKIKSKRQERDAKAKPAAG